MSEKYNKGTSYEVEFSETNMFKDGAIYNFKEFTEICNKVQEIESKLRKDGYTKVYIHPRMNGKRVTKGNVRVDIENNGTTILRSLENTGVLAFEKKNNAVKTQISFTPHEKDLNRLERMVQYFAKTTGTKYNLVLPELYIYLSNKNIIKITMGDVNSRRIEFWTPAMDVSDDFNIVVSGTVNTVSLQQMKAALISISSLYDNPVDLPIMTNILAIITSRDTK